MLIFPKKGSAFTRSCAGRILFIYYYCNHIQIQIHIHIQIHNQIHIQIQIHIHNANTCKFCICITRQYKTMQNLHLHFLHYKLYACNKSIYNNNLLRAFMPLNLICSSFAPLAVVAFFPFFCRFFTDFARFLLCCACLCFSVLACVRLWSVVRYCLQVGAIVCNCVQVSTIVCNCVNLYIIIIYILFYGNLTRV